jgi:hypothetical protein
MRLKRSRAARSDTDINMYNDMRATIAKKLLQGLGITTEDP